MTQSVLVSSNCVGVLIFELSYQSRVNNFYRANFYPDISSGLAQLHQFLSGKMPPAFPQNSKISIRTDLRNFKEFRQFLSGSGHGIWGYFPGSWSHKRRIGGMILLDLQNVPRFRHPDLHYIAVPLCKRRNDRQKPRHSKSKLKGGAPNSSPQQLSR